MGQYVPLGQGGAPATTNPVGSGQTVGNQLAAGQMTPTGVAFWDPNKNAVLVDSRPVPGMITQPSPLDAGNSQFIQPGSTPPSPLDAGNPNYIQPDPNEGPKQATLGDAMQNLLSLAGQADPTTLQILQEQLVKGGFLDPTKKGFNLGSISGSQDPTYTAYYQLMEQSIRTGTDYNAILQNRVARDAGKKYEDALKKQQAQQALAEKNLERQTQLAADALVPHTINRTVTDISDPTTAQGLLTQTLTAALGRAPTTDEIQQFTSTLNNAQQQNPQNIVSVTDPSSPYQDKSKVTTGGLNPQQFTQNYVNQNFGQEKDSVGEATGFYKAALAALGPGGR